MNRLLAPLLRLFRQLSWNIKFALVGGIALLVMSALVVLAGWSEYQAWRTAQNEEAGLNAFVPTLGLLVQLQQHRGMSAGALAGNAAMRAELDKKRGEVDEAAKAFSDAIARTPASWRLTKPERRQAGG